MTDTCHFCGGPDACYQKKDRTGKWQDACWKCVVTKKPTQTAQEPAQAKESLFTELD